MGNIQDFLAGKNVNGFFRGLVVDIKDPEHRGRVRVRVPMLHGIPGKTKQFINDFDIPWAMPASFLGLGPKSGVWIVPKVNSNVFITFEGHDLSHLIYFGSVPFKVNAYRIDETEAGSVMTPDNIYDDLDNVINNAVYISKSGIYIAESLSDGFLNLGTFQTGSLYTGLRFTDVSTYFYKNGNLKFDLADLLSKTQADELYQAKLPTPIAGGYLHCNTQTGGLEWVQLTPGGGISDVQMPSGFSLLEDNIAVLPDYALSYDDSEPDTDVFRTWISEFDESDVVGSVHTPPSRGSEEPTVSEELKGLSLRGVVYDGSSSELPEEEEEPVEEPVNRYSLDLKSKEIN